MGSHTLKTTIKRQHCSGNETNQLKQQSAVNHQNTEDNLTIILSILFYEQYSKLHLFFIPVICPFMPGNRLTQSKYTVQKKVGFFGDQLFPSEEHCLIQICRICILYTQFAGIEDLGYRHLSTALLPFNKFSKGHLFPD